MKLSFASTIFLAAPLLGGEHGLVQAKNGKEFQERRRQLLKKNNKNDQGARSMMEAPLQEEPMQMQGRTRQDYVPMMEEEMDAFEAFGGEVPIYDGEEEQEGLDYYYEGEPGIETMDQFGDAPYNEGALDEGLYFEEFEGGEDMMPPVYYEEDAMEEGVAYTQEDLEMMVNGRLDMGETYYESDYDQMGMDQYDSDQTGMDEEEYEYMLEEEEMFAEMGLEKEVAYQAAMIEDKFDSEFNEMNEEEGYYEEEISDEEAYENMLEEEEMYAEMGLEEEPAFDTMTMDEWESMTEEEGNMPN